MKYIEQKKRNRKIKKIKNRFERKAKKYNKTINVEDFLLHLLENDNIEEGIKKACFSFNQHVSRINKDHWFITENLYHRALYDDTVLENSIEAINLCINNNAVFEIDIALINNKVVLYHDDKYSEKLGQEKSISGKVDKDNLITLKEVLELVDGKVPIVLDLKAYSIFNKSLEKEVLRLLDNYNGEYVIQSFNPLSLKYFEIFAPHILRIQLGNSISAIKSKESLRSIVWSIVTFCLFYKGNPDGIAYDMDDSVRLLFKFNNILGFYVVGYTERSNEEIEELSEYFDNFYREGQF